MVYKCETRLDGRGFRNPAELDSARVVIVGDSFVEGLQAADDELISAQLAKGAQRHDGEPRAHRLRASAGTRSPPPPRYGSGAANLRLDLLRGKRLAGRRVVRGQPRSRAQLQPESPTRTWFGRSFIRNGAAFLIRQGRREPTVPARRRSGVFRDAAGRSTEIYFSCGVHEGEADRVLGRCDSSALKRFQGIVAEARALSGAGRRPRRGVRAFEIPGLPRPLPVRPRLALPRLACRRPTKSRRAGGARGGRRRGLP